MTPGQGDLKTPPLQGLEGSQGKNQLLGLISTLSLVRLENSLILKLVSLIIKVIDTLKIKLSFWK